MTTSISINVYFISGNSSNCLSISFLLNYNNPDLLIKQYLKD